MEIKRKHIAIAVINAVAVLGAAQALAQDAQRVERVEITGSAIKRIDAETAVPITVIRMDDLKKEGVTSVEQVMSLLSAVQMQQGTSQMVGSGTVGASFADMRGIGANKTLILLNGRRIANNAIDSSAPDLNMIPFAAISRVEVLRDGASALYGTDAIGGVINFITRSDYVGGTVTLGMDSPEHKGGKSTSANLGFGFGDLAKDKFNVFGFIDYQQQDRLGGTERPFNTRYAGGLSPTPSPANYYQGGASTNPTAPSCVGGTLLIPDGLGSCYMTTSSFVNYVPESERVSAMLKGTLALGDNTRAGIEYFVSRSKVASVIAPVPYGGLYMNRVMPNGQLNPFYPGNPGSTAGTPGIPLSATYTEDFMPAGVKPGFIHVKWRDLPNGPRTDLGENNQQRVVASLDGNFASWDYQAAFTYNENKIQQNLAGYSDGAIITAGVLNGVINPFGAQTAAGDALIQSAALNGTLQNAKGTVTGIDAHASRELGDWFRAGRASALAVGFEYRNEKFSQVANFDYASAVIASTGFDPNTRNVGSRDVYAGYLELNVPVTKSLDVTAAVRYDKYSDFGNTTNPKFSFRYEPMKQVLVRGSYSTGFRAPSLYEINAAQTYTNTPGPENDPVNCPDGVPIPGKPSSANCGQQFQVLNGGNPNLKPEKSKSGSLGIVLEPSSSMSVGLDFWWIKLTDSIGTVSAATIFADPVTYASTFHRNQAGNLATDGSQCPNPVTCGYVDTRTQNLGGVNTNGIDLSASYRMRVGGSAVTMRLQSTYVAKYEYQDAATGPWIANVGIYSGPGPIFRWQHNANVTWNMGPFDAGIAAHYKSGYKDQDPTNNVASYTTFDIYGGWKPMKNLSITAGIRNVFDRDPPLSYQEETFQAGYDPRFTDPLGRTYYLRGTYTFR